MLARERMAYYALERAVIWAVVGAVVIAAWTLLARTGRHPIGSWLPGALAGAVGGFCGGALYQGVKYLANDARRSPIHLPDGVLLRGLSYAIAAGLIGWAFAGATDSLHRREGLAAGARRRSRRRRGHQRAGRAGARALARAGGGDRRRRAVRGDGRGRRGRARRSTPRSGSRRARPRSPADSR